MAGDDFSKEVRQIRRGMYRAARVLGDVDAASRGPKAFGKRVIRRRVYREEGRLTRKALRWLGLSR